MFYRVFVHFFATFRCVSRFAVQRWLGGEPDALVDAYFYCALLVGNCTQVRAQKNLPVERHGLGSVNCG